MLDKEQIYIEKKKKREPKTQKCLYIHEKRATLAVENCKCVCFVQNKKWRKVQIIK